MMNDLARYHEAMLVAATGPIKPSKVQSRFDRLSVRENTVAPAFRVTARVLGILSALASHRYLSTAQIARLDGGSLRVVRHLMRVLHRHGFVARPAAQAAYLSAFIHEGNVSIVHTITRKGMKLLAQNGVPVDKRLDWTTKNIGTTALFLAHALEVSETMLDFRLALLSREWPKLCDHNELFPSFPLPTRESNFPYRLVVHGYQDHKPFTLRVIPDRLFSILHVNGQRQNFALELDRGTESLMPRSKKLDARATFAKKVAGYYRAWREGAHAKTWAFETFRVLTITTSDVRIDNMLEVQRGMTDGHAAGLFLYSTRARINDHGVLGPAWRSSQEDGITLVRA